LQNIITEKSSRKTNTPSTASDFGTVDYFHKSNAKTAVVLDVLKRGCAVLIIDADVILFKDPFPYFNCTSCDVHFQMDRDMYNRYVGITTLKCIMNKSTQRAHTLPDHHG